MKFTYEEKRRMRSTLYSPVAVILLAVVTFVALRAAWGMYGTYQSAVVKRAESERDLSMLSARTRELEREIARLSSDRGIEEEIRERYMVAKEGENVLVMTDLSVQEEGDAAITPKDSPWWITVLAAVGFSQK